MSKADDILAGLQEPTWKVEVEDISLRNWYAGLAMQGLATLPIWVREGERVANSIRDTQSLAKMAFAIADAMIEEAKKET